jgi:hypothetical protein
MEPRASNSTGLLLRTFIDRYLEEPRALNDVELYLSMDEAQ